jgi:dTDP-4-dehydrorhamnose 3,5-epimerase
MFNKASNKNIELTKFSDLVIVERRVFKDLRGELDKIFEENYVNSQFVISDVYTTKSNKSVVRGLHYQIGTYGQAKLVSCLNGRFLDIAVDLRPRSLTFGEVFCRELSSDQPASILIPAGFAHGTYSLEDGTYVLTMCEGKYLPEYEAGIDMRSLGLNIDFTNSIISEKDKILPDVKSVIKSLANNNAD